MFVHAFLQFISLQTSIEAEDLEIFVKDSRHTTAPECGSAVNTSTTSMNDMIPNSEYSAIKEEEPQILGVQDTLAGLHAEYASSRGNLVGYPPKLYSNTFFKLLFMSLVFQVLVYRSKSLNS